MKHLPINPIRVTSAPNAFGIDYQQTASFISLREGRHPGTPLRSVGDGLRNLIPHYVSANELWGSHAIQPKPYTPRASGFSFSDGPWLQTPQAGQFWQRLSRRLYDYIGNMEPTSASGYQIVVGVQATDMASVLAQVQTLCSQAGLHEATIINALDAVLCRWMMEGALPSDAAGRPLLAQNTTQDLTKDLTIAVVAVGDVSTVVTAYRISAASKTGYSRSVMQIRRSPHTLSLPTGQAWWIDEMLGKVCNVVSEMPPTNYELALRDAAIEYGARLSRAAGRAVTWTGPLHDRMFQPLHITVEECAQWPSVALLRSQLPRALEQAVTGLNADAPDCIVVGGMGAAWPFARQVVDSKLLWQSSAPHEDVACGAAWWPCMEALHAIESMEIIEAMPLLEQKLDQKFSTRNAIQSSLPASSLPASEPDNDNDSATAWLLRVGSSGAENANGKDSQKEDNQKEDNQKEHAKANEIKNKPENVKPLFVPESDQETPAIVRPSWLAALDCD